MSGAVNKTVYALEIVGNDVVIKGYADVAAAAKQSSVGIGGTGKAGAEAAKSWTEQLESASRSFKGVSRDIDVVGGKSAATFARMADDALGVVAAVGSGGLLAVIALASAAVGGLAKAFEYFGEAAEREAAKVTSIIKTQQTEFDAAVAARKAARREATLEDIKDLADRQVVATSAMEAQVEIKRKLGEEILRQGDKVATASIRTERGINFGLIEEKAKLVVLQERWAAAEVKRETALGQFREAQLGMKYQSQKLADQTEEKEAEKKAERSKKRFEDNMTALERAAYASLDLMQKATDEANKVEEATNRAMDAASAKSTAAAEKQLDEVFRAEDEANKKRESDEEKAYQNKIRAMKEIIKSEDDLQAAVQKTEEAERKKTDAMVKSTFASTLATAQNQAYAFSMMAIQPILGVVTSQLEKFGNINRDNYRDLLEINKNTIAAWAAQAQAALWSMALQAGQKSGLEAAEAVKEAALGFGSIAISDGTGAAAHFTSAGIHMVAAHAYAALGVGAGGTSLAIGAARGSGGLVGTGAAPSAGGGAASGSGVGVSGGRLEAGRSVSGSTESQAIVVNFTYEAGSLNAADEDEMARSVARGARRARQSGFLRRAMVGG